MSFDKVWTIPALCVRLHCRFPARHCVVQPSGLKWLAPFTASCCDCDESVGGSSSRQSSFVKSTASVVSFGELQGSVGLSRMEIQLLWRVTGAFGQSLHVHYLDPTSLPALSACWTLRALCICETLIWISLFSRVPSSWLWRFPLTWTDDIQAHYSWRWWRNTVRGLHLPKFSFLIKITGCWIHLDQGVNRGFSWSHDWPLSTLCVPLEVHVVGCMRV